MRTCYFPTIPTRHELLKMTLLIEAGGNFLRQSAVCGIASHWLSL